MNRNAKLAYIFMMTLIVSHAIAVPTHTGLLSGISGKKGILSYSTLDALKKRLYQKRYYLAALLAVGSWISFSTNQKSRKLDRYSEFLLKTTGSLMEELDKQGRILIKRQEEREYVPIEYHWRIDRERIIPIEKNKLLALAEKSRKEIWEQTLFDIDRAEYKLRQEEQTKAEETDDYIREAKKLGVTVWGEKAPFRPIVPGDVPDDPLVELILRAYKLKRGNNPLLEPYYSKFGDHDGFFGLLDQGQFACTPFVDLDDILTTLTHALSNKDAKQKLFCSIVRQFEIDKDSLNLNTRITYDKQDPESFFLSSNSPEGTNLLDSKNPVYQAKIIPYKGMRAKHGVNLDSTNDSYPQDELEEVCFGRGNIAEYYFEVPEKYIKKTLFGTCPDMGVAKRRTDRRLFEAVLYLLIQQMASDPAILSKFIGKQVVADSHKHQRENFELQATYELDEEHAVGKNRIGKMITYAIQQILLPENRQSLMGIIKYYRWHAFILNKSDSTEILKGAMSDLLQIIFGYYLPTPAPEVKPVRSRISPPQGQ